MVVCCKEQSIVLTDMNTTEYMSRFIRHVNSKPRSRHAALNKLKIGSEQVEDRFSHKFGLSFSQKPVSPSDWSNLPNVTLEPR
jgi:hypothetical protein